MDNPQELKKLIIKQLVEKGEYDKVLSHLGSEEKDSSLTKLIKPMSAVADILTENAKGAFMEDLEKRLDEATTKGNEELRKDLEEAHETLKIELQEAVNTNRDKLSSDILTRVTEAQERLQETLARYADNIVTKKADSMFSDLGELARLSEEEIQEIVDEAALSVETQIASVIGDYISETGITTSQITDFDEAVKRLLPTAQQVTWESIVGRPDISQGGTNTNIVRALIAEALANFSGGGLPNGGTTGQVLRKQSDADGDADWETIAGSGIVETIVAGTGISVDDTDPANPEVALDSATQASLALADSAVQPGDDISDLNNDAGYTTNTGTVTSVAVSGSDGIEVDSGSPITANGTIALGINKTNLLSHLNVEDGAEVNTVDSVNGQTGVVVLDADNVGAISKDSIFYNVKDYGALGDNVADDYAAIQAAIDAAGQGDVVYFPTGEYRIGQTLVVKLGVTLRGNWSPHFIARTNKASYLKPRFGNFTGDSLINVQRVPSPSVGVTNSDFDGGPRFEYLVLSGVNAVNNSAGTIDGFIVDDEVRDVQWNRVTVSGFTGHGWKFGTGAGYAFDHCVSNGNGSGGTGKHGFYFPSGMTDVEMNNVYSQSNDGDGYHAIDTNAVSMIGCRAEFNLGYGYVFTGINYGIVLSACNTDRNIKSGFYLGTTGDRPIVMSGCLAKRDGKNDDITLDTNYSGYEIVGVGSSEANRQSGVILSGCGAHVAPGDTGGLRSPRQGIRITNGKRVEIVGGYYYGVNTAIIDNSSCASWSETIFGTVDASTGAVTYGEKTNRLTGLTSTNRDIGFGTRGGGRRWVLRTGGVTESGSNVGSDFSILRYDDSGNVIDTPFLIKRSNGYIGLGISSPTEKFDVDGNGKFSGTVTTPAIIVSSETASTLASFDGSKNIKSLATASYPSLTEIAYVKGVTSAIQTQLNAKVSYTTTTTTSSSAPTPTGDAQRNELIVTALAENATIGAPTGTPVAGNMLKVVITASGGTRTVGYNAGLTAGNVTRTTSVPSGKTLVQVYQYQNATWKCHYNDLEA